MRANRLGRRLATPLRHGAAVLALAVTLAVIGGAVSFAREPYSLDKLQAFVTAARKVEALVQKWEPILRSASASDRETMRLRIDTEVLAAIEKTDGMSVIEYREILGAARADPGLARRIRQISLSTGSD